MACGTIFPQATPKRHGRGGRYADGSIERELLASQQQHWPTWVVVIAVIILVPPIVWALSSVMSILGALSIGGILILAGVFALFVWGLRKAEG